MPASYIHLLAPFCHCSLQDRQGRQQFCCGYRCTMHFHALFVYTCCCRLFYQHHLWPSGNITQHNEALGQHISRYPLGGSGILYQDIISWHYRNKERRTARVARSPAKMSARYSISGKVIRSPPPHIGCHLEKNKDPARGKEGRKAGRARR